MLVPIVEPMSGAYAWQRFINPQFSKKGTHMRERLDCALIGTHCAGSWTEAWVGQHCGGRLHFHSPLPSLDAAGPRAGGQLAEHAMVLRRFDICLMPIHEGNLAW